MNNPNEPRVAPRTKLLGTALSWLPMFSGMLFAPQQTMAKARAKRDEVIADATRRGANVEIGELRRILEASKESYDGAAQEAYIHAVHDWISFVQAKYGTSIPFDECCKLAEEFEADSKRYRRSR
jgi:hypothetical protein